MYHNVATRIKFKQYIFILELLLILIEFLNVKINNKIVKMLI